MDVGPRLLGNRSVVDSAAIPGMNCGGPFVGGKVVCSRGVDCVALKRPAVSTGRAVGRPVLDCFLRGGGGAGAVCIRCGQRRSISTAVYSGGGVANGLEADELDSERVFESDETFELDFFRRSLGLTTAIWGRFVESSITTCAIIGARTLTGLESTIYFLLELRSDLFPVGPATGLGMCSCLSVPCVTRLSSCRSVLQVSMRDLSDSAVSAW